MNKLIEKLINEINKADTIIILGHERPDGDCIGSQLGLKDIIKTSFKNKKVYAVGDNSEYTSFLGYLDIVDDEIFKKSLVIVVDTANVDRVGDKRFALATNTIKIDHHVIVDSFADLNIEDVKAPATAQIITEILYYNRDKLSISKHGAEALYVGILTDTGRFKYDNVTSKTHILTGFLLDYGVSPLYIDNNLSVDTFETLKLKGYVLSNFKLSKHKFAYIVISREIIEKYNVTDEQAASLVNTIASLKKVYVWALIIQYKNMDIKVRLRSKGPDINLLAAKYNGGGHPKASGASLENFDQLDDFINDVDNLLIEYKNNL
ncbi:MAG: DHH family phosphoesterase [Anaeroplasmataceae bacterium]